jgi:hypothetical protein
VLMDLGEAERLVSFGLGDLARRHIAHMVHPPTAKGRRPSRVGGRGLRRVAQAAHAGSVAPLVERSQRPLVRATI